MLAFTLIGLQLRPILASLQGAESLYLVARALVILATVIFVRMAWVIVYGFFRSRMKPHPHYPKLPVRAGILVGWSGMRGIVTLAAAMALPERFPYRDFIILTAFVVVLGTLLIQGPTLRPLLSILRLPKDDTVDSEIRLARESALHTAIEFLEKNGSTSAGYLILEYQEALSRTRQARSPHDTDNNVLRRHVVTVARQAIAHLRHTGVIGDDAFRYVEEELDWLELSASEKPPVGL